MEINDYDIIADLYDIYVPATFDFDFFLKETAKTKGEVLELMSGSGRVSIPLLQAGVKLTCVDISVRLNAILVKKLIELGLQADVYTMDVCELSLGKQFEQVIIPFASFAHITSPEDQLRALKRIRAHLVPGGSFLCTLGNPQLRRAAVDGQLRMFREYPLGGGGRLLLWVRESFIDEQQQVVQAMQFYEEYDARGAMTCRRLMELHFRLTARQEFEKMAAEAGFSVKALYGDYEYSPFDPETSPMLIWVMH